MIQKRIECISPTSLYHTVTAHGWVKLSPWRWDSGTNELSRPERLGTGKLALVRVFQSDARSFIVEIDAQTLGQSEHENIKSIVKRWLSIDWDPRPVIRTATTLGPRIALFIKHGGGRFLRCSTFYEDFVKTVCTINTNWASTRRMVSSLVNRLGDGVFPTPLEIIEHGEEFLRQELRFGFRARVVAELSRQLMDQGIVDCQGNLVDTNPRFEDLLGLRGIGQYSASHLMMLCHDFGRVPIDSEVIRYCKDRYNIEPEGIQTFFAAWGDYKFLGYKLNQIIDDTNWAG